MVTRVAAAQEGPDEAMRQVLAASNAKGVPAASSTMKASAASDADMVEKNQIGGKKISVVDFVSNVLHHNDQVAECRGKNTQDVPEDRVRS